MKISVSTGLRVFAHLSLTCVPFPFYLLQVWKETSLEVQVRCCNGWVQEEIDRQGTKSPLHKSQGRRSGADAPNVNVGNAGSIKALSTVENEEVVY